MRKIEKQKVAKRKFSENATQKDRLSSSYYKVKHNADWEEKTKLSCPRQENLVTPPSNDSTNRYKTDAGNASGGSFAIMGDDHVNTKDEVSKSGHGTSKNKKLDNKSFEHDGMRKYDAGEYSLGSYGTACEKPCKVSCTGTSSLTSVSFAGQGTLNASKLIKLEKQPREFLNFLSPYFLGPLKWSSTKPSFLRKSLSIPPIFPKKFSNDRRGAKAALSIKYNDSIFHIYKSNCYFDESFCFTCPSKVLKLEVYKSSIILLCDSSLYFFFNEYLVEYRFNLVKDFCITNEDELLLLLPDRILCLDVVFEIVRGTDRRKSSYDNRSTNFENNARHSGPTAERPPCSENHAQTKRVPTMDTKPLETFFLDSYDNITREYKSENILLENSIILCPYKLPLNKVYEEELSKTIEDRDKELAREVDQASKQGQHLNLINKNECVQTDECFASGREYATVTYAAVNLILKRSYHIEGEASKIQSYTFSRAFLAGSYEVYLIDLKNGTAEVVYKNWPVIRDLIFRDRLYIISSNLLAIYNAEDKETQAVEVLNGAYFAISEEYIAFYTIVGNLMLLDRFNALRNDIVLFDIPGFLGMCGGKGLYFVMQDYVLSWEGMDYKLIKICRNARNLHCASFIRRKLIFDEQKNIPASANRSYTPNKRQYIRKNIQTGILKHRKQSTEDDTDPNQAGDTVLMGLLPVKETDDTSIAKKQKIGTTSMRVSGVLTDDYEKFDNLYKNRVSFKANVDKILSSNSIDDLLDLLLPPKFPGNRLKARLLRSKGLTTSVESITILPPISELAVGDLYDRLVPQNFSNKKEIVLKLLHRGRIGFQVWSVAVAAVRRWDRFHNKRFLFKNMPQLSSDAEVNMHCRSSPSSYKHFSASEPVYDIHTDRMQNKEKLNKNNSMPLDDSNSHPVILPPSTQVRTVKMNPQLGILFDSSSKDKETKIQVPGAYQATVAPKFPKLKGRLCAPNGKFLDFYSHLMGLLRDVLPREAMKQNAENFTRNVVGKRRRRGGF